MELGLGLVVALRRGLELVTWTWAGRSEKRRLTFSSGGGVAGAGLGAASRWIDEEKGLNILDASTRFCSICTLQQGLTPILVVVESARAAKRGGAGVETPAERTREPRTPAPALGAPRKAVMGMVRTVEVPWVPMSDE